MYIRKGSLQKFFIFMINSKLLYMVMLISLFLVIAIFSPVKGLSQTVRLKDISTFSGVRSNQLVGYGLVVGLSGTGDGDDSKFTIQSITNMLENMGVRVNKDEMEVENVAAVMATADMPVSARPGSKLDVTVSSIGDADSLLGGVLLMTPLKGIDGKVYALAQGPLALGGYSAEGEAATATKNITTVAKVPSGATVERPVPFKFNRQGHITIHLDSSDFSTTKQVTDRINQSMAGNFAQAEDVSTIVVDIPKRYQGNLVPLMASLENLKVQPGGIAKVVVDEKTGTVVLGSNVRLSQVAIAHGNLNIVVQEKPEVSQPGAFSGGETREVPRTQLQVEEENRRLVLVEGAKIQELVDGLNAIGASPRDLISILRTLKSAGALHAKLEVL